MHPLNRHFMFASAICLSVTALTVGCAGEPIVDEVATVIDSTTTATESSETTSESTTTIAATTTTEQTTTTTTLAPIIGREDAECQLADLRANQNSPSVGFPLKDDLPTEGELNFDLAVVSFEDLAAEGNLYEEAVQQAETLSDWIDEMSGSRLSINWRIQPDVIAMPFASTDHPVVKRGPNYINMAKPTTQAYVGELDNYIDFTDSDLLVVVLPRAITAIDIDISFSNFEVQTAEGPIKRIYAAGEYFYGYAQYGGKDDRLWSFWAHELMHAFGLAGHAPDSFLDSSVPDPRTDLHIGSSQDGLSKVLSTWDLFLLGWLSDREVVCLDRSDLPITLDLEPVEARSNTAPISAIVKLSESDAIVIEAKEPTGFGARLFPSKGGVVAYRVDTTMDNDRNSDNGGQGLGARFSWYLVPENTEPSDNTMTGLDPLLRPGGYTTSDGITIEIDNQSTISITADQ